MSILHDLHQFVRQDFKSVRRDNYDLVNIILFIFFGVWVVGGSAAILVLSISIGWGWLFLVLPWLIGAIFLYRFGKFYADKHNCLRW